MTGTARKLAEHRAKLCLLGLKELQRSWDLENWVLNLFFRCLDDRTAQDLRLTELPSTSSHHLAGEGCDATSRNPPHENAQPPFSPRADDSSLLTPQADSSQNIAENASANMDWYDLFNVEGDDFLGLAGSLSNPDYLNPQNLEFLYRFL